MLVYSMVSHRSLSHCSLFFIVFFFLFFRLDHFCLPVFKFTESVFCWLISYLLFNSSNEFFHFRTIQFQSFHFLLIYLHFMFYLFYVFLLIFSLRNCHYTLITKRGFLSFFERIYKFFQVSAANTGN